MLSFSRPLRCLRTANQYGIYSLEGQLIKKNERFESYDAVEFFRSQVYCFLKNSHIVPLAIQS